MQLNKLWKVTGHEFKITAATKAFVILTILGPFLIIGVTVVPSLFAQEIDRESYQLAVLGADETFLDKIKPGLEQARIHLTVSQGAREELDSMLQEGELYGYLIFPDNIFVSGNLELVTKEFADFQIVGLLSGIISQVVVDYRLEESGFDSQRIRQLTSPVNIEAKQITKTGEKVQQDTFSFIMVGFVFTLMLYMTILLYGQSIGRSVVQEKVSKTVEIMLSSVNERQLLFGKILGQAAASLLQYGVWIGMALLGMEVLGPILEIDRLPQLSFPVLIFFAVFFLLGFFLYASIYAALGAAAEDEQNLNQLAWPVIILLVLPMVSASPIIMNPASTYSTFLSILPLSSPIVMFLRIMVSEPKPWQIVLSIGLLSLTVLIVMFLSAKIFRIGILMTGKRFNLADVVKWLKL